MGSGLEMIIEGNEGKVFAKEQTAAPASRSYAARLVPELEKSLRERGLLTSLVTLRSPRFRHYLKKPANLLHDRWTYLERGEGNAVVYRLGTGRGLRQDLTIDRRAGEAVLVTSDPYSGREQTIRFDIGEKRVLSNICRFKYERGTFEYRFLDDEGGSLAPVEPDLHGAAGETARTGAGA